MEKRRFPVVPVVAVILKVMAVVLLAVLAYDFYAQYTQFAEQLKEAKKMVAMSPDMYKAQFEAFKSTGIARLALSGAIALLVFPVTWGVSDFFLALREIEFNTRRPAAKSEAPAVEAAEKAVEEVAVV